MKNYIAFHIISSSSLHSCSRGLTSFQDLNCQLIEDHTSATYTSSLRQFSSSSFSQSISEENANKQQQQQQQQQQQTKIISQDEYDPITTAKNIHKAAQWNQGGGPDAQWDPAFCAQCVDAYTKHLQYIQHHIHSNHNTRKKFPKTNDNNNNLPPQAKDLLLSSQTTERALKTMLKMKIPTHHLSHKVRDMEKLIGSIGYTPLTDQLSLRLLEANGKAGNIGRTLALLNLRKARKFRPTPREFEYAIQSIHSAGLYLRKNRNVYLNDSQQPEIDNPTRFLDAILVNMSARGVPLNTQIANRMLNCYASTGRSGKAQHYFYNVTQVVDDDEEEEEEEEGDEEAEAEGGDRSNTTIKDRKKKVRIEMKRHSPPFHKIPSDVKLHNEIKRPNRSGFISKLQLEKVRTHQ